MSVSKNSISVVVAGDVTVDWHVFKQKQNSAVGMGWNPKLWTRACGRPGGAALLGNLVKALAEQLSTQDKAFTIQKPNVPDSPHPNDPYFHHSYALWSQFPGTDGPVWRVDQFLGLDQRSQNKAATPDSAASDKLPDADIVILDDANLGFRKDQSCWPKAILKDKKPAWILVKMANPVAQGDLWDYLSRNHLDRLIAILPVNDLRLTEVNISKGLSWERTAQDIAWELIYNPRINSLSRCSKVIISFGPAGAILLDHPHQNQGQDIPKITLFFDPETIEGMWGQDHPGQMIGYTSCLTAGVAGQLLISSGQPDIHQGIQSGLNAIRSLHMGGYQFSTTPPCQLTFPIKRVVNLLVDGNKTFAEVPVEDPVYDYETADHSGEDHLPKGWWTVLADRYQENLTWVAEQIVKKGVENVLDDVPQGRFNHLLTVDRQEIESFRSVHSLVSEYLSHDRPKRPLSIAVFGAPGSGKSFGITQVAKSLAPGRMQVLEFNLSQFGETDEIIDALHLVRDVSLSGMIPLVFWDEFDSSFEGKALGWLRYFLAPMQDGAFRQGQIVHPIGRAIFVFAGGTSHKMTGFGANLSPEDARAAKVPDFISRLKGFVDILGPNPPEGEDQAQISDPYYIIRRAIILRSLLERNAPHIFEKQNGMKVLHIDSGVLNGLLKVSRYKHGIRSIESILDMSQLSGKSAFERSSLPPEDLLGLAVDPIEFTSLVQQIQLEGELLEKLAQAYHRFYQKQMHTAQEETTIDKASRQTSADLSWDELSEGEKEQNRSAVRDIPEKLEKIGFVMLPSRSDQPIFTFPENDTDLEKLAKMEHDRWVTLKLQSGWMYAPQTNKAEKKHQSLQAWDQLEEEDRQKDRALVKAIPLILAEAGYTMMKLDLRQ